MPLRQLQMQAVVAETILTLLESLQVRPGVPVCVMLNQQLCFDNILYGSFVIAGLQFFKVPIRRVIHPLRRFAPQGKPVRAK